MEQLLKRFDGTPKTNKTIVLVFFFVYYKQYENRKFLFEKSGEPTRSDAYAIFHRSIEVHDKSMMITANICVSWRSEDADKTAQWRRRRDVFFTTLCLHVCAESDRGGMQIIIIIIIITVIV